MTKGHITEDMQLERHSWRRGTYVWAERLWNLDSEKVSQTIVKGKVQKSKLDENVVSCRNAPGQPSAVTKFLVPD